MKVLFVEDESALREGVALFLEVEEFDIRTAEDGQFAWEMMDEFQPDLVITDIRMPRMSGIDLIEKIRTGPNADVPVIITSAYAQNEWQSQAETLGVSAYITKPFSFFDLSTMIDQVMN